LLDVAFGDRVFTVGDRLDFESEVGTSKKVKLNEYVTGGGCVYTDSRVKVASIMSACGTHSERTMGKMRRAEAAATMEI